MIQIIEGKRYNTETATLIAEYWNGRGTNDFHNISEALYRTPKGSWFIQYAGGALSRYAVSCGQNSTCGSKGLRALSADEAYEWLEEHKETAALEEHFADRIAEA